MKVRTLTAMVALGSLGLQSGVAAADGWQFEVEPYAMYTSITGDASVGRVTGAEVDVNMETILDNLDLGAMLHFEAHHESGWGLVLDYGFMDLGADITGPEGGVVDVGVRQGVLEAFAVRRRQLADGHMDVIVGLRWWDNDMDLKIDAAVLPGTIEASIEEDWIDIFVGLRYARKINENIRLQLHADIGGLGLESDLTSELKAGSVYQMSVSRFLGTGSRCSCVG